MFISGKQQGVRCLVAGGFLALMAVSVLAQGNHPFGVAENGGARVAGPGWAASFFGQVALWQAHFYRQLTSAVRAWQEQDGAAWHLMALSFAYGIFHALGPGHGKMVISSYVLANRQTVRNGALLALLSALFQAFVAIGLVALLGLVFNTTVAVMNLATVWLERAAYGFILLLGAWLVWLKVICPLRPTAKRDAPATHVRTHRPAYRCSHAHPLPLAMVEGRFNLRSAACAVLAAGLRPCSGALIILVFALSQGFFAAGVASVFAMAVGTGVTVAVLASVAVLVGNLVTRLGNRHSAGWVIRLHDGLQALAACAVFVLGVLLLGGELAAV
jgi:ABC-type nickel/cobalt efflux system permease component RcnA